MSERSCGHSRRLGGRIPGEALPGTRFQVGHERGLERGTGEEPSARSLAVAGTVVQVRAGLAWAEHGSQVLTSCEEAVTRV